MENAGKELSFTSASVPGEFDTACHSFEQWDRSGTSGINKNSQ